MEITEALLIGIRWLHSMAAIAWIGAALVYLGLQALSSRPAGALLETADTGYKELTEVVLPVFVLTGAVLTFDRISRGVATPAYVGVLGLKIGLAAAMFHLAFRTRRRGLSTAPGTIRWLAGLGASIVLAATILKALAEPGTG